MSISWREAPYNAKNILLLARLHTLALHAQANYSLSFSESSNDWSVNIDFGFDEHQEATRDWTLLENSLTDGIKLVEDYLKKYQIDYPASEEDIQKAVSVDTPIALLRTINTIPFIPLTWSKEKVLEEHDNWLLRLIIKQTRPVDWISPVPAIVTAIREVCLRGPRVLDGMAPSQWQLELAFPVLFDPRFKKLLEDKTYLLKETGCRRPEANGSRLFF